MGSSAMLFYHQLGRNRSSVKCSRDVHRQVAETPIGKPFSLAFFEERPYKTAPQREVPINQDSNNKPNLSLFDNDWSGNVSAGDQWSRRDARVW